jgi:hypothetical protein
VTGHPMDDRRAYVATTLVYSDRYGPREFWRGGQQVSCICDPEHGITCAYHGHHAEQPPPPRKESKKQSRRAQRIAGHLAAGADFEQAGQTRQAHQHYLAALQAATAAERPAIEEAIERLRGRR